MIQLQNLNFVLTNHDISYLSSNNIGREYFSDYQNEYDFIKSHYDQYGAVPDKATFLSKFPNFDIIEVNENKRYLVDGLIEDYNKRKLANIFNKIRKLLNENKVDDALDLYITHSEDAVKSAKLDAVDIFKDTSRYDEYVQKIKDKSKFYVSTGFKELDDILSGWDRNEELATIVARTGVGKSWCLLKSAVSAAEQGLNVGIFSGEMSVSNVAYRIDTWISHISNGSIMHGNAVVKEEYEHYMNKLPTMFKGSIKVLTPDMISGRSGVSALRSFIEKEHLDMLCIDQHSLLDDDRGAKNPVERAADISKDLKNLQVMKRIPIIAVSQQNRTAMDNGGVDAMQISASDRIGQDSSTIIFITKDGDVMTIHLVKSRNSQSGAKIRYACDLNRGILTYIPESDNALNGQGSEELKQEYDMKEDTQEVF